MVRRSRTVLAAWVVLIAVWLIPGASAGSARNIILLIGDGMGIGQVTAARVYAGRPLAMEAMPRLALVSTSSASRLITDSAAASTAYATGHRTDNGAIAVGPDGAELRTLLEMARAGGRAAGLVTTTTVVHATPAAFAAHVSSRRKYTEIAEQYVTRTRPELILGGGSGTFNGTLVDSAEAAGYRVVRSRTELLEVSVPEGTGTTPRVLGLFAKGHMTYEMDRGNGSEEPHLWEMAEKALELLSVDPDGFFLLVEGGRIDHACHSNDLERSVIETIAFDRTVARLLQWAGDDADRAAETLILVTADHETGGLTVNGPKRASDTGTFIKPGWTTGHHTATAVPLWAQGPGTEDLPVHLDNTDVFGIMHRALGE